MELCCATLALYCVHSSHEYCYTVAMTTEAACTLGAIDAWYLMIVPTEAASSAQPWRRESYSAEIQEESQIFLHIGE